MESYKHMIFLQGRLWPAINFPNHLIDTKYIWFYINWNTRHPHIIAHWAHHILRCPECNKLRVKFIWIHCFMFLWVSNISGFNEEEDGLYMWPTHGTVSSMIFIHKCILLWWDSHLLCNIRSHLLLLCPHRILFNRPYWPGCCTMHLFWNQTRSLNDNIA